MGDENEDDEELKLIEIGEVSTDTRGYFFGIEPDGGLGFTFG